MVRSDFIFAIRIHALERDLSLKPLKPRTQQLLDMGQDRDRVSVPDEHPGWMVGQGGGPERGF